MAGRISWRKASCEGRRQRWRGLEGVGRPYTGVGAFADDVRLERHEPLRRQCTMTGDGGELGKGSDEGVEAESDDCDEQQEQADDGPSAGRHGGVLVADVADLVVHDGVRREVDGGTSDATGVCVLGYVDARLTNRGCVVEFDERLWMMGGAEWSRGVAETRPER